MPRPSLAVRKRVLGGIRRLCCLGVGSEALMPELMRELAPLVPSSNGMFFWAGPKLEVANVHVTFGATALLKLYLEEFHNRREREVLLTFTEAMRARWPSDVGDLQSRLLKIDHRTFMNGEYHHTILRPLEAGQQLMLRVRDNNRSLGSLHLCRDARAPAFSSDNHQTMRSIARYVAHGMVRAPDESTYVDTDRRALFITDPGGAVLHATMGARQLISMALVPRFSPATDWRFLGEPCPEIAWLCGALAAAGHGEPGHSPPVLRRRTAWGEFVLRAYWLGPTDGAEPTQQIGITIKHREPRMMAVRRRIEALDLTGREKELCLLLARDPFRHDLADAMGVAASTVVTHQRNVHAKLGVHSRAELIATLSPIQA